MDDHTKSFPPLEVTIDRMKAELLVDMITARVPCDAETFGELHDYVDANYYGGFIDDVTFKFFDASSVADVAYANAAQSAIHAYLEQGHARIAFYHAVYDRLAREFPSMSIFEFADYVRAREDNDVEEFRNRITTP